MLKNGILLLYVEKNEKIEKKNLWSLHKLIYTVNLLYLIINGQLCLLFEKYSKNSQ